MRAHGLVRLVLAVLLGVAASVATAPAGRAQEGGIALVPSYYHVIAAPGDALRINLDVANYTGSPQRVALEVADTPGDLWIVTITGLISGYRVKEVHVGTEETARLDMRLTVPASVEPGDYTFTLQASTPNAQHQDSLDFTVTVQGAGATSGSVSLDFKFPQVRGPVDSTFEFSGTVSNFTSGPISMSLTASPPAGWEVSFKPAFENTVITSVTLNTGSSQGLKVVADPPDDAAPGEYAIPVLVSGAGRELAAEFGVVLTGKARVGVSTPTGRLNAEVTAGKSAPIALVVFNDGNAEVRDVDLIAQAPQGWQVAFEPSRIATLGADRVAQVTAMITAPGDAIPGDYRVTVLARASQASDSIDLRVSAKQSTLWGWVGLALVAVVVAGLVALFLRLGRR